MRKVVEVTLAAAVLLVRVVARGQSPAPSVPAGAACDGGKVRVGGGCCWPGQQYSPNLEVCVGKPACPDGMEARGDQCAPACAPGTSVGPDTQGHCCWLAQAWSSERKACVGAPRCPTGMRTEGEWCFAGCAKGQLAGPDTQGHCCWPAQAWSSERQACVGTPRCDHAYLPIGEACVPADRTTPVGAHGEVAVRFTAGNDDDPRHYELTVDGSSSCRTPCTLALRPGDHRVSGSVRGGRDFYASFSVEGEPTHAHLEPSQPWARTAGIVFLGIGAVLVVAAAVDWGVGASHHFTDGTSSYVGTALSVAAAASLVIGPLFIASAGHDQVVLRPERHAAVELRGVGIAPLPSGGATAGLTIAF